jgi:hypothetical protein
MSKRQAESQITSDDPPDDGNESNSGGEGTWKKANSKELSERRYKDKKIYLN